MVKFLFASRLYYIYANWTYGYYNRSYKLDEPYRAIARKRQHLSSEVEISTCGSAHLALAALARDLETRSVQ